MPVNKAQKELVDKHVAHQIDIMRLSEGLNRDIRPIFKTLQRELLAELSDLNLSAYRKQRLSHLLAYAEKTIAASYKDLDKTSGDYYGGIADFEQEFTVDSVKAATSVELGTTLTAEQLSVVAGDTLILGNPSSTWWARQSVRTTQQFSDQMKLGFIEGEGVGALGRRVRQVMDVSKREAETLARTSIQAVSNEVRDRLIGANSDLINGYIHTSTLDNRTSFVCISRDNLKWNNKKEPVGHSKAFRRPPLHYNCRSTLVPWLRSFKDLSPKIQSDIPEGTRVSMNGSVPQSTSYPKWLKGQSKATQVEVLGRKRYELWKKGSLSLRQLTNQAGRPLTLEQIKAR